MKLFTSGLCILACEGQLTGSNACDQSKFLNNTCEPEGAYDKTTAENSCGCEAACNADARCDHWVINTKQTSDNCHFKSTPRNPSEYKTGSCVLGPGHPAAPTPAPEPAPPGAKNVLFLVVDDLRNELGYTNKRSGIKTPELDKLAGESMVFDRAYCQQGVCSPTRNSFLRWGLPPAPSTH
jgi:hypothetical protein